MYINFSFLIFFFFFCTTYAQNTISTAGNDISGQFGSLSFTIGQVFYTTNVYEDGFVLHGVQQPNFVVPLNNQVIIALNTVLYPNPTNGKLVLKIDTSIEYVNLKYSIYTINGEVLLNSVILTSDTQIDIQQIPSGIYILTINDNDKLLKSYKIIKNYEKFKKRSL